MIGPFFNHNPTFGFECDSEDIYLEDDEEMEVLRVKGGVQPKDGFGKELKGMQKVNPSLSVFFLTSFI